MDKRRFQWALAALLLWVLPASVDAQDAPPAYTQAQLDQLLAPIALYPDSLMAQILMASTYPLEVVEAERWLQDPQNAALKGDPLAAALEQQPWDPSVKSLVPFPQVLLMMDKNLQWTEQLGDAFLAEQPTVMDTVQQLRQQAETAGTLQSTPQQTVSTQDQAIEIQPADAQTVYVPYYNPAAVYGTWPYPDYPPYYFPPSPGLVYYDVGLLGFGLGLAILAPFWGWEEWDWHHHRIDINNGRFSRINHDRPPIASGEWQHDPAHRHGVPYHSAATRTQFQPASEASRRSYRGYSAAAVPQAEPSATRAAPAERVSTGRAALPNAELSGRAHVSAPVIASTPRQAPAAIMQRPSAPMFESLPHGADTRTHAIRGASSRSATAPPSRAGGGNNMRRDGDGNERRR